MGNGWTATAGEDFIAIASNLSVIDLLSKDETVPFSHSAIERKICVLVTLTVDLYRALRAHYCVQETEAHPDPACQQLCDQ